MFLTLTTALLALSATPRIPSAGAGRERARKLAGNPACPMVMPPAVRTGNGQGEGEESARDSRVTACHKGVGGRNDDDKCLRKISGR
jgi:hypothetical protein